MFLPCKNCPPASRPLRREVEDWLESIAYLRWQVTCLWTGDAVFVLRKGTIFNAEHS
jgi:hypothetical protein